VQRLHGLQKRFGIGHARFRGAPVSAVCAGVRHVERLLARAPIHRIVQGDPVVRAHADVDEHAQRGARDADRVGAVLQDVVHGHLRAVGHLFDLGGPELEVEDRIDGVRVIDVVGRKARRIGCAGGLPVAHVPAKIGRRHAQVEQAAFFPELVANRSEEVRPPRQFRILRRVEWIEPDVAEAAGHANQIGRLRLARVLEILLGVPRRGVEIRVVETPQPGDAAGHALDAWNRRLVADVHPQPVFVGAGRRAAAGLGDGAERGESSPVKP
jgi:hypothetical protein